MDRGAWRAAALGIIKSRAELSMHIGNNHTLYWDPSVCQIICQLWIIRLTMLKQTAKSAEASHHGFFSFLQNWSWLIPICLFYPPAICTYLCSSDSHLALDLGFSWLAQDLFLLLDKFLAQNLLVISSQRWFWHLFLWPKYCKPRIKDTIDICCCARKQRTLEKALQKELDSRHIWITFLYKVGPCYLPTDILLLNAACSAMKHRLLSSSSRIYYYTSESLCIKMFSILSSQSRGLYMSFKVSSSVVSSWQHSDFATPRVRWSSVTPHQLSPCSVTDFPVCFPNMLRVLSPYATSRSPLHPRCPGQGLERNACFIKCGLRVACMNAFLTMAPWLLKVTFLG